jgi:hypothetical protein
MPSSRAATARSHPSVFFAFCLAVFALSGRVPASAQTRTDTIAEAQAAKAAALTPQAPLPIESFVTRQAGRLADPQGLSPAIGTIYSGGWLAIGPSYRRSLGERTTFYSRGMYSIHRYVLAEATVSSLGLAVDTLDVSGYTRWLEAKEVSYFGLGPDTSEDARAHYAFRRTEVGTDLAWRPVRPFRFDAGIGYEIHESRRGQGDEPPIDDVYDEASAPGLTADPEFVRVRVGGALDWRPAPGYSRTGGTYGIQLHRYQDTTGPWDFSRLDVNLVQHVPLFNESIVLSFRGLLQTVVDGEDRVPYFAMPTLGGSRTLRGFSSHRFTGPHVLAFTGEYRWMPYFRFLDAALFFDAGMAALKRTDLAFDRLESSAGIGVRLHSPTQTLMRVDLARSREGWRIIFTSSPVF